jgi:hypothetical protein
MLNREQWQAHKGQAETQGNNKKLGNNSKLIIAKTQGGNKKGSIGDPWR